MLGVGTAGCGAKRLLGGLISSWKELGMIFTTAIQPPSKRRFRHYGFAMLIGCVTLGCDKVESLVDDAKKDMGVGAPAQNVETPATPAQPAPVAATPQPAGPSADVVLANLKSKAPNVIDDQTLVAVANVPEAAAQITELDLRSNINLTGVGVAAVGKFSNLTKLQISSTPKVETGDFNALGTLNALTELEASNTKISNDNLVALSGLQQLKKLSLAQTALQGPAVGQLSTLPNLEELQLDGTGTDDEALAKLKSLPLKKLTLQRTRISNNGLLTLNDHPTLETLDVGETAITGLAFSKIKLANLRSLNAGKTAFGVEGLMHVRKYPKLEELLLFQAGLALDNGSQWDKRADFKQFPSLRVLNLGANQLSDVGLNALISGCKELEELYLHGTKGISDRGLATLLKCKKLKVLDVVESSVTPNGAKAMKEKMPELVIKHSGGQL